MNSREIWVVSDQQNECIHPHIRQILSKAVELGHDNDYSVTVVCIGRLADFEYKLFQQYGADKVIVCSIEEELSDIEFCNVLEKMVYTYVQPALMMFPSSRFGKAVASYMSVRFESGLTADCIDIKADGLNGFVFSRAALNSSVIARIVCINSEIKMCTVKFNVFREKIVPNLKEIIVEEFHPEEYTAGLYPVIEILSREINHETNKTTGINDAKRIFAFGRGSAKEDNIEFLKRNAGKYDAYIVGTRAVVEDQLLSKSHQVGQSGLSIAPEIYVSFGVSGATQHIVGIANSKIIVAVNNDSNAPIFEYSDYAVIDDSGTILRELAGIID